jgi:hypothetical protein
MPLYEQSHIDFTAGLYNDLKMMVSFNNQDKQAKDLLKPLEFVDKKDSEIPVQYQHLKPVVDTLRKGKERLRTADLIVDVGMNEMFTPESIIDLQEKLRFQDQVKVVIRQTGGDLKLHPYRITIKKNTNLPSGQIYEWETVNGRVASTLSFNALAVEQPKLFEASLKLAISSTASKDRQANALKFLGGLEAGFQDISDLSDIENGNNDVANVIKWVKGESIPINDVVDSLNVIGGAKFGSLSDLAALLAQSNIKNQIRLAAGTLKFQRSNKLILAYTKEDEGKLNHIESEIRARSPKDITIIRREKTSDQIEGK